MSHACYDFDYSTYSTSITRSEIPTEFSANFDESYIEPMESDNDEPTEVPLLKSLPAPRDKYNFVFISFITFGVCSLLPWNFFITANDYWMYKFRDVHTNASYNPINKTMLQSTFTSYLAITNNVPFIFVLFINPFIAHKISETLRNGVSVVATGFLFVVITILVKVNSDTWQNTFFAVTMMLVCLISIMCGIFQSGASGLASVFPSKYMYGLMTGQAVAGIISSLAEILSLLKHTSPVTSAFSYFICAVGILLATTLCYFSLHKTIFFQFYTKIEPFAKKTSILISVHPSVNISLMISIFKRVWIECLTVMLVNWVTLSVFPALSVLVVSEYYNSGSAWSTVYFLPICCFLLFNVADFTGRSISLWLPLPPSWDWQLLLLAFLRVIYIPLFMLCNAHPRSHMPILFHDIGYIVLIITMGITNGYVCTLAMMAGPNKVDSSIKEVTGFLLIAFLGTGLAFGSLTSYLLVKLL